MTDWRVARSLLTLRDQINQAYPGRSKASDGTIGDAAHRAQGSDSDHNPWYVLNGTPLVTALDVTHDPAHGLNIEWLSDDLDRSRDRRIKYVIANGLIMSGAGGPMPWVWRTYLGSDPHANHLHVSVVATPAADDPTPWNLGGPMADPAIDEIRANVAKLIHQTISNDNGTVPGPIPAMLSAILTRLTALEQRPPATVTLSPEAEARIVAALPAAVVDEVHRRLEA